MKMVARPLDALDKAKGKRVLIKMKNGSELNGVLGAFDMHLNLWLTDADVTDEKGKTRIGSILLRGDTLVWVSPAE